MNLIFPSENEVMKFFRTHSDFHAVYRISELLISPHHNNVQDTEWQHVRDILHRLKRNNFLIVKNEGGNIYEEKFSSTPDRVQRYFEKHYFNDVDNLQVKTDDELKEIMRARIENQHLPHSVFHRAKQELEFRRQPGIINNGIIAAGPVTAGKNIDVGNASEDHVQKKWWKRPEILIGILGLIIALISIPYWYISKESKSDKSVTQLHGGSGDNVAGDKNVVYSVDSLPARELNEQVASCILDQLSRLGGKIVTFQLYGSWVTIKNETGGGVFGQLPDNETINFAKQIATLLKDKKYEVDEMYTSISSFSVDDPTFTGLLVKKGDDDNTISILIGSNDGKQVQCN